MPEERGETPEAGVTGIYRPPHIAPDVVCSNSLIMFSSLLSHLLSSPQDLFVFNYVYVFDFVE